MTKQYIPVNEAEHGCCNEASVADTYQPNAYNECGYELIAECPNFEYAKLIADALNGE